MNLLNDPRIARLILLIRAALHPPKGAGRVALALCMGMLCHITFAAAVLAMIVMMYFGLSKSFGTVPWPMAALSNVALIIQFPRGGTIFSTSFMPRSALAWVRYYAASFIFGLRLS